MQTETKAAESMTPSELLVGCQSIAAKIGPASEVSVRVSTSQYSVSKPVQLTIYPRGIADSDYKSISGATWPEAFAAAHEWAISHKLVRRNAIIRRMALAVIEITDEFGRCDEARLKVKDFAHDEIIEFHEAACQRASEMAGNAPFHVEFAAGPVESV